MLFRMPMGIVSCVRRLQMLLFEDNLS